NAGRRRLARPRARPALHAAAAPPRRLACRQIAARMRLSFDLHHPQRRAAIARDGDRNAGAAFGGGRGEKRGVPPPPAPGSAGVGEYWVTRLQRAEAMWAAAGLPRLRDLAAVGRPQTAGLAPARRAARREGRARRTTGTKNRR